MSRTRKLLSPALLLTLLAGAFTFDDHGVAWLWTRQPGVAVALAVAAIALWVVLGLSLRRRLPRT